MMTDEEVHEALKSLERRIPDFKRHLVAFLQTRLQYVVQRRIDRNTGEWENVAVVVGKNHAFDEMNKRRAKSEDFHDDWRVLPRNEADKLMEGINIGLTIASNDDGDRRRRPLMHMPEHL